MSKLSKKIKEPFIKIFEGKLLNGVYSNNSIKNGNLLKLKKMRETAPNTKKLNKLISLI